MNILTRFSGKPLFAVLLLLAVLSGLAGCGQKQVISPTVTPGQVSADARRSLSLDADRAWQARDFERSEILYRRLLDIENLSEADTAIAWERFSLSALSNGHNHLALDALPRWAAAAPSARHSATWQDAYITAIRGLGDSIVARDRLSALYSAPDTPWALRGRSGMLLSGFLWREGRLEEALTILSAVYGQAEPSSNEPPSTIDSRAYRAGLEAGLLLQAEGLDRDTLDTLLDMTPEGGENSYPYSILAYEYARRLARTEEGWPQAWQIITRLLAENAFTAPAEVSEYLNALEAEMGQPVQAVALALPLSGPYASIGWKVLRGAGAAQWVLAQQGMSLDVRVINTAAEGWEQQLEALPPSIRVVGGPLRRDVFEKIHAAGHTTHRAWFTFLASLDSAEEGREAWRFFPSARDQVRSVISAAIEDFGVTEFGVLSPDESYGHRMASLFNEEVWTSGASVSGSALYQPSDVQGWGRVVAQMLNVPARKSEDDELPPETPFQAVFLPDGWKQARMLVPQFFFYQEDRLIFLGTSLWSQGVGGLTPIEMQNFRFAIFPTPWWEGSDAPAASDLRNALASEGLADADFWTALGYDFVRCGSLLGSLPSSWTAEDVNRRLVDLHAMQWSMAPIHWNTAGKASQSLFLFRPDRDGMTPVDRERLAERNARIREMHERRVESLKEKIEQERREAQASSQ